MSEFKRISPAQAQAMLSSGRCLIADIRDQQSYQHSHVPGALHLGNHNLQEFVDSSDHDQPLIVYCYHGISSQNAAQYLADQQFTSVYSMDGGFELWQQNYPDQTES